jgi:hypothetical protein
VSSETQTIAARRHRALARIRAAALVLGVLGSIALCYQIGLMFAMQDLMGWTVVWSDTSWFAWALALLVPSVFLYLFDRRIARWLIPVPHRECHECGYPLRGLRAGTTRCPECGTALSGVATLPSEPAARR